MMEVDSVFEKVRQKIDGAENIQVGGDFQQSNIQIFVIDKQQLADVLEVVLERSPESSIQVTPKSSTWRKRWKAFILRKLNN